MDRQASRRFPDDVHDVLTAAGWRPGRDVSTWVEQWLASVYAGDPEARERLPLFPAARVALTEFGGLRFTQLKRLGYAGGGFRVELWPNGGRVIPHHYTEFGADIGVPVFPFAWFEDGSSDLVIDATGRVFLLHQAGEFLVGDNLDDAITALVGAAELKEIDDHGNVIEDAAKPGRNR